MTAFSFSYASKRWVLFSAVFAGLMAYWIYLAFVSQPILVHDAKGYQSLGQMIASEGWQSYFVSGPNREPLYPFLIAFSMKLTSLESFLGVLKSFQVCLLGGTTLLVFLFLLRFGVSWVIALTAMVYVGLSAAMVNTALSVYSEIAAHIFVLGIAWLGCEILCSLQKQDKKNFVWPGVAWAVLFILVILVKSAYEVIFYLCLIPFAMLVWRAGRQRNHRVIKNTVIFLLTAIAVVQAGVGGYKYLNYKYNGLFVMTDRAAWALYGSAARRQQPLTLRSFGAAVAYNLLEDPGCQSFYSVQECRAWDVVTSDKLAAEKNYEVSANFPRQKQNKELLRLSFAKILENPLQYAVLMGMDWVHLFFWESTRIGFVAYPDWLDKVYDQPIFARGLRFCVGTLSLGALLFSLIAFFQWGTGFWPCPEKEKVFIAMGFVSYMILCHTLLHALFFTVPRFSLPIASLFIVLIALMVQVIISRKCFNQKKELG